MITPDGWFTWAIREPGPEDRARYMGGQPTNMTLITHHSLEGYRGSYSALFDPARFPTAWHWTVAYDGTVYQHYPVTARLVHGNAANVLGPGGESEGVAPEPLRPAQVTSWLRIHRDISAFTGRTYYRVMGNRSGGLAEHREVGPTACPSERYAPLWAAILLEDEMNDMDRARLDRLEAIVAGNGIDIRDEDGKVTRLTGNFALEYLWKDGASLALGQGQLQAHTHNIPMLGEETGLPVLLS